MFDTIFVRAELPLTDELRGLNIKWNEIDYQTKSLENCMSTYEITREGELVVVKGAWWEPDEETSKASEPKEEIKVPCHGKISFYDYIEDEAGHDWFVDFTAYFTYGKLDKIELDNVDKTPVQERLAASIIWEIERKKREKKLSYRISRVLRKVPGYRWLLRNIGKSAHWLGDKIYMISIRYS